MTIVNNALVSVDEDIISNSNNNNNNNNATSEFMTWKVTSMFILIKVFDLPTYRRNAKTHSTTWGEGIWLFTLAR
jgi:hypothetical protein